MRLFVALPIPPDLRSSIHDWGRVAISTLPGARLVPERNLHLTLRFLGEVDESEVARLLGAIESSVAAHPPFEATLAGPGTLPGGSRARVAHLGIEPDPRLDALRSDVADGVEAVLGLEPESRPFRPHLTIARTRRPWRRHACNVWEQAECPLRGSSFEVTYVDLMESVLSPAGARYSTLGRAVLEA